MFRLALEEQCLPVCGRVRKVILRSRFRVDGMNDKTRMRVRSIVRLLQTLVYAFPGSLKETLAVCARSICFSSHGEDLLLHRMFELPDEGFYVDVGAFHPIRASNTFRLHLMGWKGVAVEPNLDFARRFARLRPGCTLVTCGIGRDVGKLEYIRFQERQCNTFDPHMAEIAKEGGAHEVDRTQVDVMPLSRLFEMHVGDRPIDVLSVDVEGLDLVALQSNDWARWSPSIVLVEDHLPVGSSFERSDIATFLTAHGYFLAARVHFTSFFVRAEQAQRLLRSSAGTSELMRQDAFGGPGHRQSLLHLSCRPS
jgi:FkbM family methyltransferase